MAGRAGVLAALLCCALLIVGPAAVSAADEPASDITLKDVTLSLLEASGSASKTEKVTGPTTGLKMALDHTRTVKVPPPAHPPPHAAHWR